MSLESATRHRPRMNMTAKQCSPLRAFGHGPALSASHSAASTPAYFLPMNPSPSQHRRKNRRLGSSEQPRAIANTPPFSLRQSATRRLFLLLFGLRWLRRAILRPAGLILLHDETAACQTSRRWLFTFLCRPPRPANGEDNHDCDCEAHPASAPVETAPIPAHADPVGKRSAQRSGDQRC